MLADLPRIIEIAPTIEGEGYFVRIAFLWSGRSTRPGESMDCLQQRDR